MALSNPKISIVVPVYNVEPYISRCLKSISEQTYRNIETIFVDDCGSDGSMEIVKSFVQSHPQLDCKVITHERNRGLSAARNTGLKSSTGQYVYFLDSDDEITIDCINNLVKPLSISFYDIVIGSVYVSDGHGWSSTSHLLEGPCNNPLPSYVKAEWYVMAWNKLCNREFLLSNNLFFPEGLLHEDVVWSFKLACVSKNMYLCNAITYLYHKRNASITTSLTKEKDINIYIQAFTAIKNFILSNGLEENPWVYKLVEGKKSGILYSLLQKNETLIYNRVYSKFHKLNHISPVKAVFKGLIGFSYLFRDLNYCMPTWMGKIYKRFFYLLVYRLRNKQIQGALWG